MNQRLGEVEAKALVGQPAVRAEYEKIGELLRAEGKADGPGVRLSVLLGKKRISETRDKFGV